MGYFPFFVDITGQEGLIVGGGQVALRKVQKLLPFQPNLTVAAPEILPEIAQLPAVTALYQPFAPALLEGKAFVIAATNDAALNRSIAAACQARKILVNVADDRDACTFLFPALVQQGPLTVGISTGGASPHGAVYVKQRLVDLLPENFGEILEQLAALRPLVQARISQARRSDFFAVLFSACMEHRRPLTEDELTALFAREEEQT